jgi:hypothetical protein
MNMRTSNQASSPRSLARVAGLLYLVIIVCGVGGEAFLRGPLIFAGDPTRTAESLIAAEFYFRIGILADVVMALCDVALAALLFVLLEPAGRVLSLMAMAFRLVQAAILGLNLQNLERAIALVTDGRLDGARQDVLALRLLDAHAVGYDLGLFFFGVNCVLVATLLARAPLAARKLAVLMSLAGVVYLAGSTLRLVAPAWVDAFAPAYAVSLVAELTFCVWLIVNRFDVREWQHASARA